MKDFKLLTLILTMSLVLIACSDDSEKSSSKPEASGEHVWKTQTDALKTAKDVAGNLQESLNQQKEKLNDND